jgi:hypothetical protein
MKIKTEGCRLPPSTLSILHKKLIIQSKKLLFTRKEAAAVEP